MRQPPDSAVRRTDGSIDVDFYARRAVRLRAAARNEALGRLAGALRAAWRCTSRRVLRPGSGASPTPRRQP